MLSNAIKIKANNKHALVSLQQSIMIPRLLKQAAQTKCEHG